jgi:hypothetical protein
MMLAAMRPQKTQIADLYKYNAGAGQSFSRRDLAIMFGYTDYDVLVVGGSGGRSGYVQVTFFDSTLGQNVTTTMYGCGGGGGASRRLTGKLLDLPASVAVEVGAQGSTSADQVGANKTSIGGVGGSSSFNGVAVEGGQGGHTGTIQSSGAMTQYSEGGSGGSPTGASRPLGGQAVTSRAPAAGTWDTVNNYGFGGGGGIGRVNTHYGIASEVQAGAAGASGSGDTFKASGEAAQSVTGGGGGGANDAPVTGGAAEYRGTGWNSGNGQGIVALKLS